MQRWEYRNTSRICAASILTAFRVSIAQTDFLILLSQVPTSLFIRLVGVEEENAKTILQNLSLAVNVPPSSSISTNLIIWTKEDYAIEGCPIYDLVVHLPRVSNSGAQPSNFSVSLGNKVFNLAVPLVFASPQMIPSSQRSISQVSTTTGPSSGGTLIVLTIRFKTVFL